MIAGTGSRYRRIIACAGLALLQAGPSVAQESIAKDRGPLRGRVSRGASRFVGSGGDPVNTLEPLNAKPGIFGGLVVVASWKQLQPTPDSRIGDDNVINQALAM